MRVHAAEAAELARLTLALATTEPDLAVSTRLCGVPSTRDRYRDVRARCKGPLWGRA